MGQPSQLKLRSTKATTIAVAAVFTLSVSGYFVGMRQTVREAENAPSTKQPIIERAAMEEEGVSSTLSPATPPPTAVDYSSLPTANFGPNSERRSRLSDLRAPADDLAARDPRSRDADELRRKREARRAYDGAPPVVPHPIDQRSAQSCLQCHQEALQIGELVAPAISHPVYSSCTQCHVSSEGLGSRWNASDFDLHLGNRFDGYHKVERGQRAYPDAPPTIPHALHMRQDCMSCHGPLGNSPIRTTHPERQSCNQCHVPGAEVDKQNFSESPFPFLDALLERKKPQ